MKSALDKLLPCLRVSVVISVFCRAASYKIMLAAIPAFSDSTRGECGTMISSSISAMSFLSSPAPSLPMKIAIWPLRSAFGSAVPLCDEVATSLMPRAAQLFDHAFQVGFQSCNPKNGSSRSPNHFAVVKLTVPSPKTTPAAPKASADRRIVPRFPGSWSPATTSSGPRYILDELIEIMRLQMDQAQPRLEGFRWGRHRRKACRAEERFRHASRFAAANAPLGPGRIR